MFAGVFVATVTPFADGKVDYAALTEHIEYQIEQGVAGVCPCGTTGESATLSFEEHLRVVETAIQAADGRCQVVAGAGSNSTAESIELSQHAKSAGADGVLLITPYYNKPTQEGMYRHFKAVHDAAEIPIMLYNVPSRTAVNLLPETVCRLAQLPNIVAIKEASGDLGQVTEIALGTDLDILSGDDALTLPILALGGTGVVSVVGNISPALVVDLVEQFAAGDLAAARKRHNQLHPIAKAMFLETNPIPVKTALKILGRGNGELRLPLCAMSDAARQKLNGVLTEFSMLGSD